MFNPTEILDIGLWENIIEFHLEENVYIEGHRLINTARDGNTIKFNFEYEVTRPETVESVVVHGKGLLREAPITKITFGHPIEMEPGDTLKLNYKVNWEWRGRGGDDNYVILPEPTPGASLTIEGVLAA